MLRSILLLTDCPSKMVSLIPEVHLFVCLDDRVSPGAILHSLDIARAQDWQQETVLICDEKWRSFVNVDQPVIFIDRQSFFQASGPSATSLNVEKLDSDYLLFLYKTRKERFTRLQLELNYQSILFLQSM